MQLPEAQTVVITCPNCGTRYQVPPDALGASGRKVSCAECGTAWLAIAAPPPEPELPPEAEDQLDAAFAAEQAALLAEATELEADAAHEQVAEAEAEARPGVSPAVRAQKKAEGRFRRRQRSIESQLPVARLRRYARIGAIVALVGVLAGLYAFRVEAVRMVPELARLYAAFGMPVNIVGLDFANVATQMARRDGIDVLAVTATIYPVARGQVAIPPVIVELRNRDGQQIYQWSVTPNQQTVGPGETVRLATELASPPAGAVSVRLSFATGRGGTAPAGADTPDVSSHSNEETAGH